MPERLYPYNDGDWAYGAEIREEFDQIYTLLSGGLKSENLAGDAAILGSQIAQAPNGISTDNINDDSVTTDKIAHSPFGVGHAQLNDDAVERDNLGDASVGEDELDYSDAKIPHMGVVGIKIARGSKTFSLVWAGPGWGDAEALQTITFSTDSDDGDPSFTEAPKVTYGIRNTDGIPGQITIMNVRTVARSATSIDVKVNIHCDAGTWGVVVDWTAIGK